MPYRLFLDDVRGLAWVYPDADPGEWVSCASTAEAQAAIQRLGWPAFISFDHDLGPDLPTGHDLARWLVELDLDTQGMPPGFGYAVHSANPVGRANITALLDRYLAFRGEDTG